MTTQHLKMFTKPLKRLLKRTGIGFGRPQSSVWQVRNIKTQWNWFMKRYSEL